jgi:hypothetical protein
MDSSKSPFDDPKFSGPDESRGDSPASATGIFGKVNATPAQSPQEDDWLKSLLRTETPSGSQGNAEPAAVMPRAQAASETAPASSSNTPGSFTQMFQALKSDAPPPAKMESGPPVPASPAPAKPAADLTSVFTPISVGKPAATTPTPVATPDSAPKPGEFTQLLRTLNTPVLRGESEPASQPAVEEPKSPASQAAKEPGSFTQLFNAASFQSPPPEQTFTTPASAPESVPPPTPASTAGPGAFTQMFQTLSPEHAAKNNPAATPAAQTAVPLTPQPAAPLIQEQAPATPQPAPQQPAAVGGFTQMFQSLSPKAEPAPIPPSAPPAAFEPPPPPQPKSGPGSFTQMFSQIGGQSAGQADPLASLKQEPALPSSFQFSTPAPNANPFGSATPSPDPRPSSVPPAQGGFTQLFQALGTENTPQAKEPPPLMPSPPAANPAPPAAGGFTQLLRTLNTEQAPPQAAPLPMAAASVPPAPMPQSGPGEFTRIISGSMLREAQGQNVAPGPPVMPPAPVPGGGQPAFQMPPAPAFPKMPTGAMPPAPQMHAGGGAAPQMPHFQPPPFAFPPAPAPAAPPPPAPSKLQQYLPLILVVNVFVLIVVILIVVFALRHH